MNISEFAESRNLQSQTVSIYIRRHPEQFDGHTSRDGKSVELDEVALDLLDKAYPLPQPVEIIKDTEILKALSATQRELTEAQKVIISLQAQIQEKSDLISAAQANQLLLEVKEEELHAKDELNMELQRRAEAAEAELDKLKKRSFWERLFNSY